MKQQRLVLNTLVLQAEQAAGVSQLDLVKKLVPLTDKIELRREYNAGTLTEISQLNTLRLQQRLVYFYSVPENLFVDGHVNPQLPLYVAEAQALGASYIKMTLGNFDQSTDFRPQDVLDWIPAGIQLNLENDQTIANTDPDTLQRFFHSFDRTNRRVGFVNDLGNWIFTKRDTLVMSKQLLPFTRFVHLKNYVLDAQGNPQTVAFNQGELDYATLLDLFPTELPVALEYPSTITALEQDLAVLTQKEY